MKALVTGGAGFIGSQLTNKLLELGHEVFVMDDLSNGSLDNIPNLPEENFYHRSIITPCESIFSIEKFDTVFHFAALPRVQFSIAHPLESNMANVNGTLRMLDVAQRHGVKRFVYSSSSSAYGDQPTLPLKEDMKPNPMSPYALQKLTGEQYAVLYNQIHGLETVCLRYFNVYGPTQRVDSAYAAAISKFTEQALKGNAITIFGDGEQTRDFCLHGDSRVLMSNLSWKKIKDIKVGEEVISFDEKSKDKKRKFRISKVEATTSYISKNNVSIHVDGKVLNCTKNHPWLTDRGCFRDANWMRRPLSRSLPKIRFFSNPNSVHETDRFRDGYCLGSLDGDGYECDYREKHGVLAVGLSVTDKDFSDRFLNYSINQGLQMNNTTRQPKYEGSKLTHIVQSGKKTSLEWSSELRKNAKWDCEEFCRGWLSGIFDSEGEAVGKGHNLRLSNKENFVCEKIRMCLNKFKFKFSERKRKDGLIIFSILGGTAEIVRFFSFFAPAISRKKPEINNREVKGNAYRIEKIEDAPNGRVYNLQIENHRTFIAEGFLCHNTFVDDVVNANIQAATLDLPEYGRVVNVGCNNQTSVNQIVDKISEVLGIDVNRKYLDPVVESKHTRADVTVLKEYLQYVPKVNFDEGIRITVEGIKERFDFCKK